MVTAARAAPAQLTMGMACELDAITAAVFGTLILGAIMSGFTFLRIGPYYQETFKGATNVTAVMGAQICRKRRSRV